MSFREVRSFAETMRWLGYPNLISMESFKKPNVELVAHCMYWLIKRYDPSAEVDYVIELQSDRVFFFKQVCKVALSKGRIKLNVKKLYESNGHAVQEMLKLAGVLKNAMKSTTDADIDFAALQQMAAQKNVNDAKQVQKLCSDITADGSTLFFLIEKEMGTRADRLRVLSRSLQVSEFERRLRELLQTVSQQVEQLQQSIANLTADESNLEQKIENKKTQLERAQKRLKSLLAVPPPFVEEYDKNEAELQSQFVKYLEQYRNLEYLEHELAVYNMEEDARLEEQETKLRVMRERLRKEELKALRQDGNMASGAGAAGGRRMLGSDSGMAREGAGPMTMLGPSTGLTRSGSSEDDSDSATGGPGGPPRPQNALGRSRPSPTVAETIQRNSNPHVGMDDESDDDDTEEEAQPPATGPGGMGLHASNPHRKPPAPGRGPHSVAHHMLDDSDSGDEDASSSELSSTESSSSDVSLDSSDDSDI
eukprot:gene13456-9265_t